MPRGRDALRVGGLAVSITFVTHFLWEVSQAPFFSNAAGMGFTRHALVCLAASLGDVLITAAAYGFAALLFRRPTWALRPGWQGPAGVWLATGVVMTVLIERGAVAFGWWEYEAAMPTVFGIGMLPVLQWVIVPAVSLATVRGLATRIRSSQDRQSASAVSAATTEASDSAKRI